MRSNTHYYYRGSGWSETFAVKIYVAEAPNKNGNIDVRDNISVHNTSRLVLQLAKFRAKYRVKQILSWITQISIGSNKFSSISQSSYCTVKVIDSFTP